MGKRRNAGEPEGFDLNAQGNRVPMGSSEEAAGESRAEAEQVDSRSIDSSIERVLNQREGDAEAERVISDAEASMDRNLAEPFGKPEDVNRQIANAAAPGEPRPEVREIPSPVYEEEQPRTAAAKKPDLVEVNVISSADTEGLFLVAWVEDDYPRRALVEVRRADRVPGTNQARISRDALDGAEAHGEDWDTLMTDAIRKLPENRVSITRELNKLGIWTAEDFITHPQEAERALLSQYSPVWVELRREVRRRIAEREDQE